MLRRYELMVAMLACMFMLSLAMSQTNLSIPVNHAATGTAIGGHSENQHDGERNLRFINAKDQPGVAVGNQIRPAYLVTSGISNGLTEALMRDPNNLFLNTDVYPSVLSDGAWQNNDAATEAFLGLYSESPYRFGGIQGTFWYWSQSGWPADPQPITCAITPPWSTSSYYVVVGLDRIGDATATHYFELSRDGGLTWEVVPNNGPALAIMPTNLATTDVAIEDASVPDKLVTVTTQALDDNDLPLLTDHVDIHGIFWTNALRSVAPEWHVLPVASEATWNLQISMKNDLVFGVAYLPGQSRQAVYFGDFTGNALVDWQEVPVSFMHPLPDAIPYDFEIGPMVNGDYTLLTTNSDGLYYSPNQGADWYKAENFASDAIRTPELREFSIDEDNDGVHRIAIAGWYASYVGAYNPVDWEFDLQEITYDPTLIDLYQNYNQAWTALSKPADMITYSDIALVDHSNDPIFPDDRSVTYQAQIPGDEPKTVFLGNQDTGTRPFVNLKFSDGNPWIVYNPDGEEGPTVADLNGPDFLTSTLTEVGDDPADDHQVIIEATTCPIADYIICSSLANPSQPSKFYYRKNNGTEEWHASPENFLPNHCSGTDDGNLFGAWQSIPGDNIHLLWSANYGETFQDFTGTYPTPPNNWDDHLRLTDVSMGFTSGMSLNVGGYYWRDAQINSGAIYRWTPGTTAWPHKVFVDNKVTAVAAHPTINSFVWAALEKNNDYATLAEIHVTPNGSYDWRPIWTSNGLPHEDEYHIRDVKVTESQDFFTTDIVFTLETPASNDAGVEHTIAHRISRAFIHDNGPLPAVVSGEWIIDGEVTIPSGQTLTVEPGATLLFASQAKLIVEGTLIAEQATFSELIPGQSSGWQGIYVGGNATLTSTTIDGATTGLETSKATSVNLIGCTFTNCGTGLIAYQPSGTGIPQITGCTFSNNDTYGASLLSTASVTFDDCNFTGNGADGMLLTNSYAKIIGCDFTDNGEAQGGYGLNCFGSSPMLSCNNFDENFKGEIVLYNQSYPAMEPSGGGGKNTLFNSTNNLISTWSSYPLTKNGHNNFTVGGTGYFMADMSAAPKKRDISGNYWNPSLGLSKLYPSSSSVYTWNATDGTVNSCGGTGSGSGAGAAQQMFAEGLAEQSNGNYSEANALLADVVTQYPDSEWANAALAQMFVTQCMVGDNYPTLQTYMNDIADDSTLAEPAEAFATRLWVENEQYAPALETYEATMTNPPSEVDSIFAAVDFAVATYRAQAEGGSLDEVNSADVKDIFSQLDLVSSTIPPSPQASHEGFTVIPSEVTLEPNFPNPFNAETTIRYYLPEAQFAEVTIFNIVGQKVAMLVSGQMSAGFHDAHWSGSDLASGVYLYQLKAGRSVETRKMVLLK